MDSMAENPASGGIANAGIGLGMGLGVAPAMLETMKSYLPIGSIVLLKNGKKKVMIYGRRQRRITDEIEYDYIACLYPEGNIGED